MSEQPARYRLRWFVEQGLIPQSFPPCAIAAGYERAFGRPPARLKDPHALPYRVYSLPEMVAALAELAAPLAGR
jgi:hypothetical protein